MGATYRVRAWEDHFENHESRKVKGVRWVAMPNKHDGKSYRRVAQRADGVQIFCAWALILQVASKMPVRGVLADEDGPLDSDDLSAMTGFPAEIFDLAFKALTENKIGWLELLPVDAQAEQPADSSRNLPEPPGTTGKTALEGNGREGNGTPPGGGEAAPPPPEEAARGDEHTGKEAVRLYRRITGRQPKPGQRDEIARQVTDLAAWESTLQRRTLAGKDASRVDWILEDYRAALPPPPLEPEVFDDPHLVGQREKIDTMKQEYLERGRTEAQPAGAHRGA